MKVIGGIVLLVFFGWFFYKVFSELRERGESF